MIPIVRRPAATFAARHRSPRSRSDGRTRHCAVSTLLATNVTAASGASALTSGACERATTHTRAEARSASASTPRRRIENAPTSMSLPRSSVTSGASSSAARTGAASIECVPPNATTWVYAAFSAVSAVHSRRSACSGSSSRVRSAMRPPCSRSTFHGRARRVRWATSTSAPAARSPRTMRSQDSAIPPLPGG